MNVALVSILTNGSDLKADVGAISLTINDVVNVWIVGEKDFRGGASRYQASQPQQTQLRVETLDGMIKEGWPKVKLSTALNDINELIRECQSPIVMWDFDPVSFIDAHAFLWTSFPDLRPHIRRCEGDMGNFFLSALACFKGVDQGFMEYNGFYSLRGRAAKAHSLIYKYLSAITTDQGWKDVPKIKMRDIKDRESETCMADPDFAGLPDLPGLPTAAPVIDLPVLPAGGLNLPGL